MKTFHSFRNIKWLNSDLSRNMSNNLNSILIDNTNKNLYCLLFMSCPHIWLYLYENNLEAIAYNIVLIKWVILLIPVSVPTAILRHRLTGKIETSPIVLFSPAVSGLFSICYFVLVLIHLLLCVSSVSGNSYHVLPYPRTLLQKLPLFHALRVSLIIDSGSEPQLTSSQFLGTHFVF